ncbi:hypothetical protein ACIPEQ_00680 [Curtobacterium sp. NPDC087080]|uniref:hypothetical protein n=1 Tax=Curtobacterium sp. NPDC087080 TaxID=3363965 RepID=UPI00382E4246
MRHLLRLDDWTTDDTDAVFALARAYEQGDLGGAMADADVVVTDGPGRHAAALEPYRITADVLALAPDGVRFAPCPPFVRGREVSADAIASPAFVGHGAKRALLPVQQAVLAHCLT